ALFGLQMVLVVLLRASGRARLAALVTLAPQGYRLVPLVLVLPRFWGLGGRIAAPPVAAGLAGLAAAVLLAREMRALGRAGRAGAQRGGCTRGRPGVATSAATSPGGAALVEGTGRQSEPAVAMPVPARGAAPSASGRPCASAAGRARCGAISPTKLSGPTTS